MVNDKVKTTDTSNKRPPCPNSHLGFKEHVHISMRKVCLFIQKIYIKHTRYSNVHHQCMLHVMSESDRPLFVPLKVYFITFKIVYYMLYVNMSVPATGITDSHRTQNHENYTFVFNKYFHYLN